MSGVELCTLLFQGALAAVIPFALVWAVRGQDRLARLAAVTAFMTFDLVVFGGFTRLTDSGLGCPDWPGCFARANPFLAAPEIARAAAQAPLGPVDMTKAWIEMIHRLLAGSVGLLICALLIMTWRARQRGARPGLALAALILVCVQAAFGAFTVTLKLEPVIVSTHLLLALLLLALLTWQAASLAPTPAASGARPVPAWLVPLATLALALLALQIALGGWVSTNYAVLACSDFPRCQGQFVPPMDFHDGFTLLRALGQRPDGSALPFAALTAIHWTHRTMAAPVATVLALLAYRTLRETTLKTEALQLFALIALQLATGLGNVLLHWPLLIAVLHNAGAAALVSTLILINYRLRLLPSRLRGARPVPLALHT